jgi:site-specific DNA-cytosine methylase
LHGYLETGNKKRKATSSDAGEGVNVSCCATGIKTHTLTNSHRSSEDGTGRGIPIVPFTASSFAQYAEGVGTVRASGGDLGGGSETLAISFSPGNLVRKAGPNPSTETFPTLSKDSGDQNPHVATPMAVRRLTPVECERLQGFPDNWSRISWKVKPEEQCPDGPRYKACGNSMAVPVMRWIGERISTYNS